MLSLETFLPRRRYSFVRLWHILFFCSALCFLPQALIWVCTAGAPRHSAPDPLLCQRWSARPPEPQPSACHPLLLSLGQGEGWGPGSMAEASLPQERGHRMLPPLGAERRLTCQQVSRMRVKEGGAAHQGPRRFRVYTWLCHGRMHCFSVRMPFINKVAVAWEGPRNPTHTASASIRKSRIQPSHVREMPRRGLRGPP